MFATAFLVIEARWRILPATLPAAGVTLTLGLLAHVLVIRFPPGLIGAPV
jgi:hypothetical protein